MFDITALGEILIDFTPSGTNGMGMPLYAQNPGGAPANVLAQSALLGSRTAFIGKVGQDGFGTFLRSVMERSGIDTRALVTSEEVHTTLAFVQLDACGDRSFSFYRNPGADILLRESEVDYDLIRQSHIFLLAPSPSPMSPPGAPLWRQSMRPGRADVSSATIPTIVLPSGPLKMRPGPPC